MTPEDGTFAYTEGSFIGYRGHHAGLAACPAFWFGSGLGHGSWEYSDAAVDASGDASVVTVSLRNIADRDSREVVQVYFAPAAPDQPVRLVGWADAQVPAGGRAQVAVRCDARMWRRWDAEAGCWGRLDSAGEFLIARGLGDVRLRIGVS